MKDGLDRIIRQASSLVVDGNAAVIPPVQAIQGAEPHAAIPGREDGLDSGIRQTLRDRNRGDSKVAKAIEAIQRGDPNVTFTILKEPFNEIARETVGAFK